MTAYRESSYPHFKDEKTEARVKQRTPGGSGCKEECGLGARSVFSCSDAVFIAYLLTEGSEGRLVSSHGVLTCMCVGPDAQVHR